MTTLRLAAVLFAAVVFAAPPARADSRALPPEVEAALTAAGVPREAVSVLVQDIGLLRLIHRLCPELPLYASTQMTIHNIPGVRML